MLTNGKTVETINAKHIYPNNHGNLIIQNTKMSLSLLV